MPCLIGWSQFVTTSALYLTAIPPNSPECLSISLWSSPTIRPLIILFFQNSYINSGGCFKVPYTSH